jgi:hypothetical protein
MVYGNLIGVEILIKDPLIFIKLIMMYPLEKNINIVSVSNYYQQKVI